MVFKVFQKLFITLYNYNLFIYFFEITYKFWKCLLRPPLEFPSLWLVDVLQYRPLIGCRENAQDLATKGDFLYDFSWSKFRVSEEGYWKDSQN